MKSQRDNKNFKTNDFALAIFLLAREVPFLGIQPTSDPKRSLFVFQKTKDLQALIQNFWLGTETVEPLRLLNAERELKKRLYSDSYKLIQKIRKEVTK
jgi:hypothetical protein